MQSARRGRDHRLLGAVGFLGTRSSVPGAGGGTCCCVQQANEDRGSMSIVRTQNTWQQPPISCAGGPAWPGQPPTPHRLGAEKPVPGFPSICMTWLVGLHGI